MHISKNRSENKKSKKIYNSTLLRESYREDGKVKKRTIANLSHCKPEEIAAMELALKHKDNLSDLVTINESLEIEQGKSIGSIWAVYQVAKQLGIEKALGTSPNGKLALWQVIVRVLEKGSRLSAVRFARRYELTSVLKITSRFSEDDLYENLEWLTKKQAAIENKLFGSRHLQSATELFLYDVTSSYLEGDKNDFGEYGYNRDGRKGKKQIVIGLLCDSDGIPVSIEVFPGNTQDTKTFSSQVQKVATRFGCSKVVFVGDRGMIKIPQIQRLPIGFHYITAITRSQIQKLCNDGVIQPEFFEDSLFEIEDNGVRYILRRNPIRAEEIQKNRQARYEKIIALLDRKNHYLSDHPKAKVETAIRHIEDKIKKLKLDPCLHLSSAGREIILRRDEQAWQEQSVFDGCYMLKTDLSREDISKEDVHARYKDLSLVESAFRTCKQEHLEVRPVYVRKKASTRGHVFVVMLSYMIIQRLREAWKAFDLTVAEGLRHLSTICNVRVTVQNKADFMRVMKPDEQSKALLSALNVTLPHVLPANGINVDTKVKLKRKK